MTATRRAPRSHGFTLVELTVVLLIIGLMAGLVVKTQRTTQGAGGSGQASGQNSSCYSATQRQLVAVQSALERFVHANGRYPAPAARNLGVTHSNYGKEDTAGTTTDTLANSNPIFFGSLPFATLALPASNATDCWGNQLTYIVTKNLTTTAGFSNNSNLGGLTVYSAVGTPLLANTAYAVISHGETGIGNGAVAKNYTGTSHSWCSTSGAAIDHENCDIANANLYSATFNSGSNAGTNFFDDLIVFAGKASSNCNQSSYTINWTVSTYACSATISGPLSNTQTQSGILNTAPGYGGQTSATCTNGTVAATGTQTCYPTTDGVCGSANNGQFSSPPSSNLCAVGNATTVTTDTTPYPITYKWDCNSPDAGANVHCSARATDCPAQTLSYNVCSAPFTSQYANSVFMHSPTAPSGYSGQIIWHCLANGTWSGPDAASTCHNP